MAAFIVGLTLLFVLLGVGVAFILGHSDWIPGLTGGGILGIVNFLLLRRTIMRIPAGGKVQNHSFAGVGTLFIVGLLFVGLALGTGRPLAVLAGFSAFVFALIAYAVKEAIHA